jgi:NitT/TauT family transport system permease protein
MLVNTLAGLAAAGSVERDLMRSYGATPGQTLLKLHLPAAMPFIFNALKINSTLALIGAIVAEFFGTPTRGVGFRISIEAARMSLDMVWAEIALAALAGMAFYGIVALAILLVGLLADREDGLAAAVLMIVLFTIYFATHLMLRPLSGEDGRR